DSAAREGSQPSGLQQLEFTYLHEVKEKPEYEYISDIPLQGIAQRQKPGAAAPRQSQFRCCSAPGHSPCLASGEGRRAKSPGPPPGTWVQPQFQVQNAKPRALAARPVPPRSGAVRREHR